MTDEQHMEFTSEEIARQREIIANAFTAPPYEIVDGNLGVWLTEQAFRILVNRVHETDIQLIMTAVNTHEAALDTLAQQQAEIGRLREALKYQSRLATEWEANHMGGVPDHRRRWKRLAEIAREALAVRDE